MSRHYPAMSAYNGFSNFLNKQTTSAASNSENSSGCSSPPSFRLTENQGPFTENSTALVDDIDLGEDDTLDGCPQSHSSDTKSQTGFHPYARNEPKIPGSQSSKLKATTAERRATHNAIERARRESLNGRFLELARALPTMHNVKRPSKSVIVNKSLEWICESQRREYELVRENAFLRHHVNELRTQLQMEPLPSSQLIQPSNHLRYKMPGFQSAGVSTIDPNRNNILSAAPYTFQSRQTLGATQPSSHGFVSLHHPLIPASNNIPEESTSPTQAGINRQPTAGPFCVSHPQDPRAYISSTLYNSSEGSDKTLEEVTVPDAPSTGSLSNDDKISSIYLPGLSIHADSGSPFQSLSEPEAPTSTTSSSPSRMRYFSCSGSSDTSENSPSRFDYSNVTTQFETDPKPLSETSAEQLNSSSALKVEILGGSVGSNHQRITPSDVPLPIEPLIAPSRPIEFDTHPSTMGCPSTSAQFSSSSNYIGSITGSHEGYIGNSATLPQVPRDGLIGGTSIDSSMLTIPPTVNQPERSEVSNGFPMGPAWVWG